MTKVIAVFIIVIVLYGGYSLFLYWEKVKNEEETKKQQNDAALVLGDQLPGMPNPLEQSWRNAKDKGAAAMRTWLKANGQSVEDPRKAWIELDYCVAVAREDTAEAKRVFAAVKERIGPASPVYPRLKQLEKTYE